MADLVNQSIVATCLTGGGAARLQIFAGGPQVNQQTLVMDIELTGAQAHALAVNLATATIAAAATTGQTTTQTDAAGPSPLPGVYNAV